MSILPGDEYTVALLIFAESFVVDVASKSTAPTILKSNLLEPLSLSSTTISPSSFRRTLTTSTELVFPYAFPILSSNSDTFSFSDISICVLNASPLL